MQRMKITASGRSVPALVTLAAMQAIGCFAAAADWMIDPAPFKAEVGATADGACVEMHNGLIRRSIRLAPNAATTAFDNLMTGESILRSVRPEASIVLDGAKFPIGGLSGQPIHNYLDHKWIPQMTADPSAFRFVSWTSGPTVARFPWKKRLEWMPADLPWPPPGRALTLRFAGPPPASNVTVDVHYEIYDGLPLLSKWIVVRNGGRAPVRLESFTSEILAAVEPESVVDAMGRGEPPAILAVTDYSFGGGMSAFDRNPGAHWVPDPLYATQVNYERQTPCLLECRPPQGPDQVLPPGGVFESFRAFEMAYDSTDRERRGIALRRLYRTVAPWVTENPVLMHVRHADPAAVRSAIDQCAEVGFELVILTFGSGFNFESRDPAYQKQIGDLAGYARSKGIALGGYSLLASRGAATAADNTQGVPARFGVMPCLGAQWGADYLDQLRQFIENAGLGVLEHDGSYPGDLCAATNHPFHRGLADSQWVQWRAIAGFYQWCRARGVYLNVPDSYMLAGSNKTGMGYRETNWSLPREHQEVIERQNVYDGTWEKTPSMGWMFVPLTQYHGGGAAATIEPLAEHLDHYGQRLANLFGAGVQACWRGPRLYDGDATRDLVKRWVGFYKAHRAILDSDLIHLRRPDGRDLDFALHVNAALPEKALLMVYNPLDRPVTKTVTVPLYYTGLRDRVTVSEQGGAARELGLDAGRRAELPVDVPARGTTWFVFR